MLTASYKEEEGREREGGWHALLLRCIRSERCLCGAVRFSESPGLRPPRSVARRRASGKEAPEILRRLIVGVHDMNPGQIARRHILHDDVNHYWGLAHSNQNQLYDTACWGTLINQLHLLNILYIF